MTTRVVSSSVVSSTRAGVSAGAPAGARRLRGAASRGETPELRELVDEEDAFALGLPRGLDDPRRVLRPRALDPAELLREEGVVRREGEGEREEIGRARGGRRILPALLAALLQLLAVALHVLHHQVLARELVVVREVVHELVLPEADAVVGVEDLPHRVHVRPEDVPVLVRALLPPAPTAPLEVGRHDELIEVRAPTHDGRGGGGGHRESRDAEPSRERRGAD